MIGLKKIDKYIMRKYLGAFFFVALIFSMIALVWDFSEKIERFMEQPVTAYQVITEYYLNFIPWINGLLIPLYALVSVIFITSRLAGNSELISIFGSGASFYRVLRPYLLAGGLITALHLCMNHFVIPNGNKVQKEFENKYIYPGNVKDKSSNIHMILDENNKAYIKYFHKTDSTARDFRLEQYEGPRLKYFLQARRMIWKGEPNQWELKDYEVRTFDDFNETLYIGKGESLDTTFNLHPRDFVKLDNQKEMMTTRELKDFIKAEKAKGLGGTKIFEVERHRRTAEPLTILILTVIGLSIAGRKVRGGIGLHLAIGIALGAVFIFLTKFSITFATNKNMPALLGVWIPNIIFMAIAAILMKRAQQ